MILTRFGDRGPRSIPGTNSEEVVLQAVSVPAKAGATHQTSIVGRAEVASGSDDPAAKAAVRVTHGVAWLLTESRGRDGSRLRSLFRKGMVLLSRTRVFRELERSKKFLRASRPALQRDGLTTEVVSS